MRRRKKNKLATVFVCFGALFLYAGWMASVFGEASGILWVVLGVVFAALGAILWLSSDEFKDYMTDEDPPINTSKPPQTKTQIDVARSSNIFDKISSDLSSEDIQQLMKSARLRRSNFCIEDTSATTDAKHRPPRYYVHSVDFFPQTKKAKITIRIEEYYRTVERYKQINYVKHPIYSRWKLKSRQETHSIKLSAKFAENMRSYYGGNGIVGAFAEDILISIGRVDFIPSWLVKKWLSEEFKNDQNNRLQNLEKRKTRFEAEEKKERKIVSTNRKTEEKAKKPYAKLQKRINELSIKIQKCNKKANSFFQRIRLSSLEKKRKRTDERCAVAYECLNAAIAATKSAEQKLDELIRQQDAFVAEETKKQHDNQEKYRALVLLVTPLKEEGAVKNDFSPLKELASTTYSLIVGCYVIRNVKNAKCYVGQSHDVIKRIRQHFRGTVPNNTIFAEDYYLSPEADRENLFEYKIYPSEGNEDLNLQEKRLIEAFDAFTSGYNRTSGNEEKSRAHLSPASRNEEQILAHMTPDPRRTEIKSPKIQARKTHLSNYEILEQQKRSAVLRNKATKITNCLRLNDLEGAKYYLSDLIDGASSHLDAVPLHFCLLEISELAYSLRKNGAGFESFCLYVCDIDISNASLLFSMMDRPFCMKTPTRKCIILEAKGNYQEAIDLCDTAIKWGIWDDGKISFEIRKGRLTKKLERSCNNGPA